MMTPTATDPIEQARRHYRWNLTIWTVHSLCCMAHLLFWPLTVATSFGQSLLDRSWVPAAMSIAWWLGSYIPQIGIVVGGERMATRKYLYSGCAACMSGFMGALAVYLWVRGPVAAPTEVLYVMIACVALTSFSMGASIIPCWDLYGRIIPPGRRGRVIGILAAVNIVPTLGYGALVKWLTGARPPLPFPRNYALLALGAALGLAGAGGVVLLLREPAYPVLPGQSLARVWHRLLSLRHDRRLRRFVPTLVAMNAIAALGTYYTGFLQKAMPAETVATAQGIQFAVYAVAAQAFGRCADRWGFKPVSVVLFLASAVAATLCGLAAPPGPESSHVLTVAGFLAGASLVLLIHYTRVQYTLLLAPPGQSHLYLAAANLPMCIVVLGTPMIGRWLVDRFGYGALFATLAVGSLLAAIVTGGLLSHVSADGAKDGTA